MIQKGFIHLLRLGSQAQALTAVVVAVFFAFQDPVAFAQEPPGAYSSQAPMPSAMSAGQLDSMVAPIALYPDPLLSQVLVASTYPQQILDANQWVNQNSNLQGAALVQAAANQPWDPSIQALAAFPQVLAMLAQNIDWTAQLGTTFLDQRAGVFDAVQRMRAEARQEGKLVSTPQQTVTTTTENGQTFIQILPANPEVVYVPQYEPTAIWGPADYYPYPSVVYPSTGALVGTGLLGFGTGVLVGSLFNGGGWGWYPGWGHHDVFVNRNFFVHNNFNRAMVGRGGAWVHNPAYGRRGEAGRVGPGTPGVRPGAPGMRPGAPATPGARPPIGQPQRPIGGAERVRPGTPGQVRPGTGPATRPGTGVTPSPRPVAPGQGGAQRIAPGAISRPAVPNVPNRGQMAPGQGFGQHAAPRPTPAAPPRINPGGPGRFGGAQRMAPAPRPTPNMGGRMGGGHFGGGRMGGGRMGGGRRR